jgi:nitroreductase
MNVIPAIKGRFSTRAFLKQEPTREQIETILEAARFAPSGVNTQPWKVMVLRGEAKQKLSANILSMREKSIAPNPDYQYYPHEWVEPFTARRKECGALLYGALQIEYGDKETRLEQWNKNYHFFGAPIGLIFILPAYLEKGSWLDTGMFIQNVMLAAQDLELSTCPQAAIAEYPDLVREHCGISADWHIVCGMALGYADLTDPVNHYRTPRESVESFTQWFD